jgi:hypothetical protein
MHSPTSTEHPACRPLDERACCRCCGKPFVCGEEIIVAWRNPGRYRAWHPGCSQTTGWWRIYHCSQACYRRQLRARRRAERAKVACKVCRVKFVPTRSDARYCSNACRQAAHRKRRTLPEAFTKHITGDRRFREAPKSGAAYVIVGHRPPPPSK